MIFRAVEDTDLIRQASQGSVESYNLLVSRWEKRVYNYLLRITGNREDALDLAQDVFLKAYQNLRKLDDPGRFGSWLYRMDYGLWLTAAPHHIGHRPDFHGPFDVIMAFFFYLPNLAITELFLRARTALSRPAVRVAATIVLNLASVVVVVGSYYFIRFYWGPGIVDGFSGRTTGM